MKNLKYILFLSVIVGFSLSYLHYSELKPDYHHHKEHHHDYR